METEKEAKKNLLEHYSNEVCSHVEAAISLFFGLIGTLIIMEVVNTVAARIVFSVTYFFLGLLGVYFYVRLFYYRKLLEGILLDKPYKDYHNELQDRVFRKSRIITVTHRLSRDPKREYRLTWAWFMLILAIVTALLAWIIVFFSL